MAKSKIEKLEKRIADLEEIIRYAIGGIETLLPKNKDALAIKETLEQGLEPQDLKVQDKI